MRDLSDIARRYGWSAECLGEVEQWGDHSNRYADLERIGSGATADVWRVDDHHLGRTVARKVLRYSLRDSEGARARFRAEATVTARLQHPGIVAVHDWGELGDGRLWFAMSEVRGSTLHSVIDEAREEESWPLRRLIALFSRAVDVVAYAHDQGVTHRDLKPDNIMVGAFRQVYVMDWGLAKLADGDDESGTDPSQTRAGLALGTPAYIAPEQARGDRKAMGPRSDVFGLGAILYELLAGRPPWRGSGHQAITAAASGNAPPPIVSGPSGGPPPHELRRLCERAMHLDPGQRPDTAGQMATSLRKWLDGAERHSRAMEICAEAAPLAQTVQALRRQAEELEEAAALALEPTNPWDPDDLKAEGWQLQDQATALAEQADLTEANWLRLQHAALQVHVELPLAHRLLADHYRSRAVDADARGLRSEAARARALLEQHDRGEHARYLRGVGTVTLVTEPPTAVLAIPLIAQHRRLVGGPAISLGHTPLQDIELAHGSWILELSAPGHPTCRYPVHIGRGDSWASVPPGADEPQPIALPASLGSGETFVPAGWFWCGGDPSAGDSLRHQRLWLDSFVIATDPVTHEAYLEFLNDLVRNGAEDDAIRLAPRERMGSDASSAARVLYGRAEDGSFDLSGAPDDWRPNSPVVLVGWSAAHAYSGWRARRDGLPWRLVHELEWEKAARGADGRRFPWGNHVEAAWACLLNHRSGKPRLAAVDQFPVDTSPYGVRGLGGNVRDMCSNAFERRGPPVDRGRPQIGHLQAPPEEGFYAVRGGSWTSVANLARSAARFAGTPGARFAGVGFRLARDHEG